MEITTVGLDIAKRVFQLHGVDAAGKASIAAEAHRRAALQIQRIKSDAVDDP